jgi:hypothetical protein
MRTTKLYLGLAWIAFALAACSSGGGTEQSLAAKGCKLDAAAICGRAVQNHTYNLAGMTADQRMVEQNEPATSDMHVTIPMPPDEPEIDVRCTINSQLGSVRYASISSGPAVSDDGVKFLRARGYCSDM